MNMAVRHKHLELDQGKLDRARRLLGVATERETVETALDVLLAEEAILAAHRRVRSVGGFVDALAEAPARRRSAVRPR